MLACGARATEAAALECAQELHQSGVRPCVYGAEAGGGGGGGHVRIREREQ